MGKQIRTTKAIAVVTGDRTYALTQGGNGFYITTPPNTKTGDELWLFFSAAGKITRAERITGHEHLEPELPEAPMLESDPEEDYSETWGNDYRD